MEAQKVPFPKVNSAPVFRAFLQEQQLESRDNNRPWNIIWHVMKTDCWLKTRSKSGFPRFFSYWACLFGFFSFPGCSPTWTWSKLTGRRAFPLQPLVFPLYYIMYNHVYIYILYIYIWIYIYIYGYHISYIKDCHILCYVHEDHFI